MRNGLLAIVLLTVGCSSGSAAATIEQIQQALQSCTQTSVLDLLRIFVVLAEIGDVAEGASVEGVVVNESTDPSDPANTFDYSAMFPSSGNGAADTTIAGKITFSADPTDGIADGDTFTLTGNVTSNGGPLSGTLNLTGTFGQSVLAGDVEPEADPVVAVMGTMSLLNSLDGCTVNATFDTPFVIDFDPSRRLNARILGIEMFGSFTLALTALGNTLTSVISIPNGAQTAQVDGELLGEEFDFNTELFPPEDEIIAAAQCFQIHSALFEAVQAALEDLPDAALNPGENPDVEITQGSAIGQFDYSVTRNDLTIAGEVNLPIGGGGTGTATFNLTGGTLVGLNLPPVTGMNVNGPITFTLTDGALASLYGALRFTTTGEGCTTTFTTPQSDPLTSDFASGTVIAEIVLGDLSIVFTIDVGAEENEGFVSATINGIPVPADALLGGLFDE